MIPILLADSLTIPPEEIHSLVNFAEVFLALAFILGVLWTCVSIWSMWRRDPPADQTFATKEEIREIDIRLMAEIRIIQEDRKRSVKDLHQKLDENFKSFQVTLSKGMEDVNRSVGRLEGESNLKRDLVEALRENRRG